MMASTSQGTVCNPSSSRFCTFKVEFKTFRIDLISLSHAPPLWDPAGGLKTHSISFCTGECYSSELDSNLLLFL